MSLPTVSLPASLIQSQLASLLAAYGEPVAVTRGGADPVTYSALCVPAPRGGSLLQDTQEAYFDDNELAGLTQPVLAVYLGGDLSGPDGPTGRVPAILDAFTRDGRPYSVQKIGIHRVGSTVAAYVLFAD